MIHITRINHPTPVVMRHSGVRWGCTLVATFREYPRRTEEAYSLSDRAIWARVYEETHQIPTKPYKEAGALLLHEGRMV